jgi:hypothetical protein
LISNEFSIRVEEKVIDTLESKCSSLLLLLDNLHFKTQEYQLSSSSCFTYLDFAFEQVRSRTFVVYLMFVLVFFLFDLNLSFDLLLKAKYYLQDLLKFKRVYSKGFIQQCSVILSVNILFSCSLSISHIIY